MDKIINILLLIIIFVFDPLAISLVIAANFAFNKAYPKKKYRDNLYGEKVEVIEVKDAEEVKTKEEFFDQLDKIEKSKKKKSNVVVDESEMQKEIEQLKRQINPEIQGFKNNMINTQVINQILDRMDKIKKSLPDDETKTY